MSNASIAIPKKTRTIVDISKKEIGQILDHHVRYGQGTWDTKTVVMLGDFSPEEAEETDIDNFSEN